MSTDVARRDPVLDLVAQVRSDQFIEQVGLALPETVSPRRFARIAITAIQQNPDIAKCTTASVFQALLRCAADGLLPDGREAALVKFGDAAQYLPMVAGFRKIAADHGWTLRSRAVYENDVFDHTEEPATLTHTPARPGIERGPLVAAYAIATHSDGRRLQLVMYREDIEKRRAVARSKNVWDKWEAEMYEKTPVRALFGELPLGDLDMERVRRVLAADAAFGRAASDPIPALYGPTNTPAVPPSADAAAPPNVTDEPHAGSGIGDGSQQATAGADTPPASAVAPGDEQVEDGEWTEATDEPALSEETIAAAGEVAVPGGVHIGKSLAIVAGEEGGEQWLATQLKKLPANDVMRPAIETFVQGRLPELWQRYAPWREANPL